jgi:hypothetical protein
MSPCVGCVLYALGDDEAESAPASQLDSVSLVHYIHKPLQAPREQLVDLVLGELDDGCHRLHEFCLGHTPFTSVRVSQGTAPSQGRDVSWCKRRLECLQLSSTFSIAFDTQLFMIRACSVATTVPLSLHWLACVRLLTQDLVADYNV